MMNEQQEIDSLLFSAFHPKRLFNTGRMKDTSKALIAADQLK
jgi:predicted acetyltransferase